MSDLRKAAQAALSYWDSESWGDSIMADKMNALRAALAQPEATTERDALRTIMRISDRAKEPCGDDPESPAAIRNGKFSSIAMVAAQGLGMVRGPSLAQPDQPTADGPTLPPEYMLTKLQLIMPLFQEARDALTAITETQRKLRGISPTLADRMDEAGTYSVDDWRADAIREG